MNNINDKVLDFFKQRSISANSSEKLAFGDGFIQYDASLIFSYIAKDTNMLDIGTGSGLIINELLNKLEYDINITCVEPIKEYADKIIKNKNVKVVNSTLANFDTDENFNLITIFGVMSYFSKNEAQNIYEKISKYMQQGAKIIIKNQFGILDDVVIDGKYSDALKSTYYANYRTLDNEIRMLRENNIQILEVKDIYPPSGNIHQNTHFYAIIGEKK